MQYRFCALITDFGNRDFFIGNLKGVIKSINSGLEIIDLNNEIPPFSILPACFVLQKNYPFFPAGTIFLVVVDPGVGSSRKILLVRQNNYYFIGPDNGVLTPVLLQHEKWVGALSNNSYFLTRQKTTFEARDKMAPVAAYLAKGVDPGAIATEVSDFIINPDYLPKIKNTTIFGTIIYLDHFGNIISNIPVDLIKKNLNKLKMKGFNCLINDKEIKQFCSIYSEGGTDPFMIFGSHNNLEVAKKQGSALDHLQVQLGDKIIVRLI